MTAPAPNATNTSDASESPTPYDLVRVGMTGATMLWPSARTVAGRYSERTSWRDNTLCHRSCPTAPLGRAYLIAAAMAAQSSSPIWAPAVGTNALRISPCEVG